MSHTNNLSFEDYRSVLLKQPVKDQLNRGFRMKKGTMHTYSVTKSGLNHIYVKRKVLEDGLRTTYLDI